MPEYEGAEHDGVDALLAAITDEPLPDGALEDERIAADHQAALADVAVLREQLGIIGAALAEPGLPPGDPAPGWAPAHPPGAPGKRSRRPGARRALAVGTMIAAALAGVVVGMSWLVVQSSGGDMPSSDSGSSKQDVGSGAADDERAGGSRIGPGQVVCARIIAEGTVVRVERVPGARHDLITVDVDRYYKPGKGKDEITFPMAVDARPPLRGGDHTLVVISGTAATPDVWTTDEKEIAQDRAGILEALPEANGPKCAER